MLYWAAILIQLAAVVYGFWYISNWLTAKFMYEQKIIALSVVTATIKNIGYFFVLISSSTDEVLMATNIEYVGSCFAPFLFCIFIVNFCGVKLPRKFNVAVSCVYFGILLTLWSNQYHRLFYKRSEIYYNNGITCVKHEYGPLFYVFLAVSVLVYLACFGILIRKIIKERHYKSKRTHLLINIVICVMVAIGALVLYFLGLTGGFDISGIALLVCILVVIRLTVMHNMFDVVKHARESVVNNMDDALITVDDNYCLLDANSAAKNIFPQLAWSLNETRIRTEMGFPVQLFDGIPVEEFNYNERIFEKHVTTMQDDNKEVKGFSAFIFDVTATHKYVDELVEMRDKAEAATKAKSDFLANMSHEIRTPMNAIIGMSEMILRSDDKAEILDHAKDIKSASHNLLAIINDILDISKIEAGQLTTINDNYQTRKLFDDITSVISIQASRKGLEFKTEIASDIPAEMFGDPQRIRQVLINILNNAVKFTKSGSVVLKASVAERNGDEITLSFAVTDTGIGIKPEDIKKLFGEFQQIDMLRNREIEGTGLGLAISKKLAKMMDGDITVDSVYGVGSTFTATIKQKVIGEALISDVKEEKAGKAEKDVPDCLFVAPEAKVLVVDDNAVNLKVAIGLLKQYKIVPDTALSGRESIELIKKNEYDMVFMDHMMPEMDGVQTLKEIRKLGDKDTRFGKIPIVAFTANAVRGVKEMLISEGFQGYVSKPIDMADLENALLTSIPENKVILISRESDDTKEDAFTVHEEKKEEKQSNMKRIQINGVDIEKGLKNCGGDYEQYIEVVKIVQSYGPAKLEELRKNLADEDMQNYIINAHSLKSTAANIGATELSEMSKSHEFAGKAGDFDFIKANAETLFRTFEVLLADIDKALAEMPEAVQPAAEPEPIQEKLEMTVDELKWAGSEISNVLAESDSEKAIALLGIFDQFTVSANVEAVLEKTKSLVSSGDYANAKAAIDALLATL